MEEYYRILRLCAIVKQRKNVPRRCRKLALHDIIFSKYKTLKIFHRKEFFLFFKNEKERFSIWCLQKRKNVENDCFRFSERAQSGASEDRQPPAGACGNAGAWWKFFPSGRALRKARVAERPSRPFREQDGLKSCGKARVVRCPECRTGGAGRRWMLHPSRLPSGGPAGASAVGAERLTDGDGSAVIFPGVVGGGAPDVPPFPSSFLL